jgi:outer membrane receptor protein involved in Fe transport
MKQSKTALLACAALCCATAAQAQVRSFDVPAEDAVKAIPEFARQAGIQIVAPGDRLKGVRTPAIAGSLELHAALSQLLAGTGIEIASDDGQTIILRVPSKNVQAASNNGAAQSNLGLEVVQVVGTNIRGEKPIGQVITLDHSYIDSTGYSSTPQLLQSLPQNFARANESGTTAISVTGSRTQGSGIDLRGLGEGTTLVLLNGRRLPLGFEGTQVDISAIPLAAIERVDVLTDGASAIYGADAVGGVVNFVLKQDYDGAETRIRGGLTTDGGADEYRFSQTLGKAWDTGSVMVAADYYHRDLLRADQRDFIPNTAIIGSLLPRDNDLSLIASAHQSLASNFTLFSDVLYSHRISYNQGGRVSVPLGLDEDVQLNNPQISATAGFDWFPSPDWRVEGSGSYGTNATHGTLFDNHTSAPEILNDQYESPTAELKADGPLFTLPAGDVRLAAGGSWRKDSYGIDLTQGGFTLDNQNFHENVFGVFGELSLPLVGVDNAIPGVRQLDLSLAGRYDHYSNFGGAFDPRVALRWKPIEDLSLYGTYGTSYVAPKLSDQSTALNATLAIDAADPAVPGETSTQVWLFGIDAQSLKPQKSRNFTVGANLVVPQVSGMTLGVNYYNIHYTDVITAPPSDSNVILNNPQAYASLITRNPSAEAANQYVALGQLGQGFFDLTNAGYNPNDVNVLIDFRIRNLSVEKTDGLDFNADYQFDAADSHFDAGFNGVYVFDLVQQVSATSPSIQNIGTIYNPPHFRARFNGGWKHDDLSANLYVNYVGSYSDNRFVPSVPISSYTTFDVSLSYALPESEELSGSSLTLSVTNLFDQAPPETKLFTDFDLGFDPTNASPLGRLIALELVKKW